MPDPLNSSPTVSVVLPARNAESTIDEAVRSVLSQTFTALELIVVDDGSTDGTPDRLRRTAAADERVRVLSSSGEGTTAALNHGMAHARGRFVARQDADDVSMPHRLERQVLCLEERPALCAVGTAAVTTDSDGHEVGRLPTLHGTEAVRQGLKTARVSPVHGSMLMRRECVDAVGGYRAGFVTSQDYDLWLRLLERWDIDNIDEPLYRWRLSGKSVYGAQRQTQLMYSGVALAFAMERARFGTDSYQLFVDAAGELERFADEYRLAGVLRAIWGELLLRGANDPRRAARHFRLALGRGDFRPRTLALSGWTSLGLPWLGSKPLRAPTS